MATRADVTSKYAKAYAKAAKKDTTDQLRIAQTPSARPDVRKRHPRPRRGLAAPDEGAGESS